MFKHLFTPRSSGLSLAWISVITIVVIVVYAIIVPIVLPEDQTTVNFANAYSPPSSDYWFGTDSGGHDLFVRTAQALRISLIIAVITAIFSAIIGTLIEVTAAIADRLSVMFASRFVEQGAASAFLEHPHDQYTRALLAALPSGGMVPIPGFPPSLVDLDDSVTFESRVEEAEQISDASHESSPAELASERKLIPRSGKARRLRRALATRRRRSPFWTTWIFLSILERLWGSRGRRDPVRRRWPESCAVCLMLTREP